MILVTLFSRNIIAGLFIGIMFYVVAAYVQSTTGFKSRSDASYLGNEEDFLDVILRLITVVVKADGKVLPEEKEWIEKQLIMDFKPQYAKEFIVKFNTYLGQEINLKQVCRKVNMEFDMVGKYQLLRFLIRVSTVDGKISDAEYFTIKKIARNLRVTDRALKSIFAMYGYHYKEKKSSSNGYRRRSKKVSLSQCYQILQISESASDQQVKKAYRKLAVMYHPDKVAHLGEAAQLEAKENFQKISDAYEMIKDKRGFK